MRRKTKEVLGSLGAGDHLCCIYGSEEEHRALVAPYLRQGLEREQKVLYITDENPPELILSYLRDEGVDADAALREGRLEILSAERTYLAGGRFDPGSMVRALREAAQRARAEGYALLRGSGEMGWALRGLPGSERLLEYEAMLNSLAREEGIIALCQYDRRRFPNRALLEVLATHPLVVVGEECWENFFFLDPSMMVEEAGASGDIVGQWLARLEERERISEQLREAERMWERTFDAIVDPVMLLGADFRILRANRAACRLLGAEEERLLGRRCYELAHGTVGPAPGCPLARMLDQGGPQREEMPVERAGALFEVSVEPLGGRREEMAVHVMHDVTPRRRLEEELRRSEELLEATQRITHMGGWRWDAVRGQMHWTEELYRLHGFLPGEVEPGSPEHINRSLACYHPEDRRKVEEAFRRCCETGQPYDLEVRFTKATGEPMWVRTSAQAVMRGGRVVEVIGNFMDITDRKRAEEALLKEHEQFLSVLDAVEHPIYVADPDTYEVLFVNRALRELLGKDPVGGRCYREFQGREEPCGFCTNQRIKELDGRPYYWERHNELLDRDYYLTDRLIDWPDGRRVRFELALDITDRKRAEEALRRRERELRRLTGAMLDMVGQTDVRGVFTYISPSCERILGYRPEEMVGRSVFEFIHPEDLPGVVEAFGRGQETLEPGRAEYRYRRADGTYVWLESIGNPLFDEEGELIGAVFTTRDVSERRRIQEELAFSRERYRRLLEAAPDAVFVADTETGLLLEVNRRAEELTGYGREELVGMHQSKLHPPEEEERYRRVFREHLELGAGYMEEAEVQRRDGSRVPVDISFAAVEAGGRRLLLGNFRDVSERQRMRRRLERINRGLLSLGADPRENIRRILGLAAEALEMLLSVYCNLERRERLAWEGGEVRGGPRDEGERACPVCLEALERGVVSCGSAVDIPPEWRVPEVDRLGMGSFLSAPVVTEEGKGMGVLCLFAGGKRAFSPEDKELAMMLARALAIEEGRLAYQENLRDLIDVASHELRHPVTVMKGYASMLRERKAEVDEASREVILEIIDHGADRLDRLVEGLLDVSRIERGRFRVVPVMQPLGPLLRRAVEEMRARGFDNPFEVRVEEGLGEYPVDGERLVALLVHLLENAVKFSTPHDPVEVEARRGQGGEALVSVLDRGSGIAPENRERIFERFFQEEEVLHHSKPGLGMGLYIGQETVRAHGGRIWCEPREGGGTVFRFTLPAGVGEVGAEGTGGKEGGGAG